MFNVQHQYTKDVSLNNSYGNLWHLAYIETKQRQAKYGGHIVPVYVYEYVDSDFVDRYY